MTPDDIEIIRRALKAIERANGTYLYGGNGDDYAFLDHRALISDLDRLLAKHTHTQQGNHTSLADKK